MTRLCMDSFDKKKKQGIGGSRPSDKWGGGRGAGHPDTEIRGEGARSQKNFCRPLKIRGEPGPPGPVPCIRHCKVPTRENELILSWY